MSRMASAEIVIENDLGLHARPAALVVQTANRFSARISLEKDGEKVDAKSLLGVMTLAAPKGSRMVVTARGMDADEAVEALARLARDRFGEP